MDSNYGDVGQSWRMSSQAPLDSKSMVNRLSDLTDLGTGNRKPFLYYRGMRVYCHQDKNTYEWTDNLTADQTKLLLLNYEYPTGAEYDGIDYSGKEFNFVKVETQYSIRKNFLENEGSGVDLFNGLNETSGNSKIARLNSSTQKLTKEVDGSVKSEIDIFNRGSEDAISLYDFFPGSKTHAFSKLKSKTVLLKKDLDGTLNIEVVSEDEQSLIRSFYVNSNSPGPIYDGSILRPYKTFDDAMTAFKGSGSNISPEWGYRGEIILQTDITTSVSPTSLNGIIIRGENVNFVYTGSDDYMLDSEVLYSQMSFTSPGVMTKSIYIRIYGNINFTRDQEFGLFRCIGADRNPSSPIPPNSPFVKIDLGDIGSKLVFSEYKHSDSLFTEDISYSNGTPFSVVYGTQFKASTSNLLKPTTPLFYLKYSHSNPSLPTLVCNGKIVIISVSQTNFLLDEKARIIMNELDLDFNPERVAYDNTQSVSDYGTYKIYAPHTNRNAFEIKKQTSFFGKIKVERSSGFGHAGFDSFFKIDKDASFDYFELDYRGQEYVKQFVNSSQDNDRIILGKGAPTIINNFNIRRLVNGNNNTSELYISMPNTIIYTNMAMNQSVDEFLNVLSYKIGTEGSISSINGRPYLTGLVEANDNTDAKLYGKVGALYYDLTVGQNFITQIRP